MEKNQIKTQSPQQLLVGVIRKWKINQPLLAEAMGMTKSTFKLKLNETNGKFSFTHKELMTLASVIDRIMADLKNILDELDQNDDDLL